MVLVNTGRNFMGIGGEKMKILQYVLAGLLVVWVIIATVATLPMDIEYKWQSWAIVAFGPVIVVTGLVELLKKVFK